MNPDRLVIISDFPTVAAAAVVRARLEEEGIRSLIDARGSAFISAGVLLLVSARDIDRALIHLRDELGFAPGGMWSCADCGEAVEEATTVCPMCGADRYVPDSYPPGCDGPGAGRTRIGTARGLFACRHERAQDPDDWVAARGVRGVVGRGEDRGGNVIVIQGWSVVVLLGLLPFAARAADGPDATDLRTKPNPDGPVSPGLVVLPEDTKAATSLLSRRSNAELLALLRSPRIEASAVVADELFARPGLSRAERQEVIERLAELSGTHPDTVLLAGLYRVDRLSATDDGAIAELGEMLIAADREAVQPKLSTILRLAKYGKHDVTKECGWAAYVMVLGDAEKALQYAKTSTSRLQWMLRGLRRVPDRSRIVGLRTAVAEIANEHTDESVCAAAYRGLVACDPSSETIDFLLDRASEPDSGLPALVALADIPPADFAADRIASHVETFVAFAGRLDPQERVLVATRARGTWPHAVALVERLPEGAERSRLRNELEAVAVRTVVLRTVRQEMRFERTTIEVEAGRVVEILYENPDDLPQNLLVIAPGSIGKVGAAADAMTGRLAFDKGFIPELPEVLAALPTVQPHSSARLVFAAPTEPGEYHYVSTIAEHWRNMQGTLRVVGTSDCE